MENMFAAGDLSPTTARQNPNTEYYQEALQKTDVQHQEITYWKYGRFETVPSTEFTPIDLQKALSEIDRILWEYKESIGFTNGRNKDAINMRKIARDMWHVEVPIFTSAEWDGYAWTAETDTRRIKDVTRMFFDELEWFGMLDFAMLRYGDYVRGKVIDN